MARRKKDQTDSAGGGAVAEALPAEPVNGQPVLEGLPPEIGARSARGGAVRRLSFVIGDDDTLDVAGARDETKRTLRNVLADPRLAEKLGVEAPAELSNGFTPSEAGLFIVALGKIQATVAGRFLGYPPEVAAIFDYTKPEIGILAPPAAKVLNKRLGPVLLSAKDEVALIFAFLAVMQSKVVAAQSLMRQMEEEKSKPKSGTLASKPEPVEAIQ